MSATRSVPKSLFSQLFGTDDAEQIYNQQFVDTGLTSGTERMGGQKGHNVSKNIRRTGQRRMGMGRSYEGEQDPDNPHKHDGPDIVHLPNHVEGWGNAIEQNLGHRNAYQAIAGYAGKNHDATTEDFVREFAEETMDDAESVYEKVATAISEKAVDSPVIEGATPIMVDPEFVNTVRSQAPVLDWVDVVAQAGFYASYNIVSDRDDPTPGWSAEADVLDLSDVDGSAFTMPNEEKRMKIWTDVMNVSDFAARAQSSLDFMDLEGTTMELKMQEYAINEAETVLYGNSAGGLTDGLAHDTNAPDGAHAIASDATNTTDVSAYDLSGSNALFDRIKEEVLTLYKETNASLPDLGIVTSVDVFHALESEANVNVRLDQFDEGINYGRDPTIPTLSIANVPVLPDPNVRAHTYGSGEYDGDHGDVFIWERSNYQRRALSPVSSVPLGQLGLANRSALFQYETPIDRSQGEHMRVLEGFDVTELGA